MPKDVHHSQDLELLLQRHACRVGMEELHNDLAAGHAVWRRRQILGDMARYAVAAGVAIVLLVPHSVAAQLESRQMSSQIAASSSQIVSDTISQ